MWENNVKICIFITLLTTQIFVCFLDYVTRNAAVSSSSITKSHLIISWLAQKSVLSLSFLRCVSLEWVALVYYLN